MHTEKLLEFLTGTTVEGLPAPVLDAAKLHVLDTLGIALAATSTPHAPQIAAALDALSEDGNATVIGSTRRRSLSGAILLNGALAHGIDFDDSHKFVHPGCAVIPVALAFAEHYGATGREFLKAVVCGYEMSVRVSLAAGVAHRKRGFHPTGTCNVFGAAIAGGLLAGLDCDQLRAAVGVASSQASGLTQYRFDGGPNKHLHAGLAGRSAALAIMLAKSGFAGTRDGLDGELGFLAVMADGGDAEALTQDLGRSFAIGHTDIKPYPSCRQTHAPIDISLQAVRDDGIKPSDIDAIDLYTYAYNDRPWYVAIKTPASGLEAMLSIPYCIAAALVRGRVALQDFEPDSLVAAEVLGLMNKVRVHVDDELTSLWPAKRGARLALTLKDGRTVQYAVEDPSGGDLRPITAAAVREKFALLAAPVLGGSAAQQLENAIQDCDQVRDIGTILRLLRGETAERHGGRVRSVASTAAIGM
jgi:2-methylcitrate dehydratase PrpD